jgi:hypothetical protein
LFEGAEARRDARRARQASLGDALRQHRLVDDQFADEIDEPVDTVEIDADRRRRSLDLGVSGRLFSVSCAAGAADWVSSLGARTSRGSASALSSSGAGSGGGASSRGAATISSSQSSITN